MAAYRREVDAVAGHFKGYQVEHIDHRKNEAVDALSRLGSQHKPVPPNTFLDVLHNPSVKLPTDWIVGGAVGGGSSCHPRLDSTIFGLFYPGRVASR